MIVVIKLLVFIGILTFIYLKLNDQDYSAGELIRNVQSAIADHPFLLMLVFGLMPLNWMLEALKWQYMSKKVIEMNFIKALYGVLAGLSLSFITPHGLGDYVGRIMLLDNTGRGRLGGAILLGRLCQMSVTIILGLFGASYFIEVKWILLSILMLAAMVIAFAKYGIIGRVLSWKKIPVKLDYYLGILKTFDVRSVRYIFFLSFLRYMIFASQLMILLQIFTNNLDWYHSFIGTTWVFLAKSVIPSFNFLSDLGVREFSAIYFFQKQPEEIPMIVVATLLLWGINILLPTLAGAPLIFKMKIGAR